MNIKPKSYGKNKMVKDSFQAFLVEGAKFTSTEEYPIIPKEFISDEIPKEILPFDKALKTRKDLSKTYICFYAPDESFLRVMRKPKRYLKFFSRTAGIIMPDFSIHTDMQIIKQKEKINENLSLCYYYGSQGIRIIPNLRCGVDELLPEFLETIPKNTIVAVGTHGFIKYKHEKFEWYCFLEKIIEELNPSSIVVYGSLKGRLFDELKEKVSFYEYQPWIKTDRKRRESNVY